MKDIIFIADGSYRFATSIGLAARIDAGLADSRRRLFVADRSDAATTIINFRSVMSVLADDADWRGTALIADWICRVTVRVDAPTRRVVDAHPSYACARRIAFIGISTVIVISAFQALEEVTAQIGTEWRAGRTTFVDAVSRVEAGSTEGEGTDADADRRSGFAALVDTSVTRVEAGNTGIIQPALVTDRRASVTPEVRCPAVVNAGLTASRIRRFIADGLTQPTAGVHSRSRGRILAGDTDRRRFAVVADGIHRVTVPIDAAAPGCIDAQIVHAIARCIAEVVARTVVVIAALTALDVPAAEIGTKWPSKQASIINPGPGARVFAGTTKGSRSGTDTDWIRVIAT